jgi:hypothetical protein
MQHHTASFLTTITSCIHALPGAACGRLLTLRALTTPPPLLPLLLLLLLLQQQLLQDLHLMEGAVRRIQRAWRSRTACRRPALPSSYNSNLGSSTSIGLTPAAAGGVGGSSGLSSGELGSPSGGFFAAVSAGGRDLRPGSSGVSMQLQTVPSGTSQTASRSNLTASSYDERLSSYTGDGSSYSSYTLYSTSELSGGLSGVSGLQSGVSGCSVSLQPLQQPSAAGLLVGACSTEPSGSSALGGFTEGTPSSNLRTEHPGVAAPAAAAVAAAAFGSGGGGVMGSSPAGNLGQGVRQHPLQQSRTLPSSYVGDGGVLVSGSGGGPGGGSGGGFGAAAGVRGPVPPVRGVDLAAGLVSTSLDPTPRLAQR